MKIGWLQADHERKPTGSGEERTWSLWRFGRWQIKLVFWRGL